METNKQDENQKRTPSSQEIELNETINSLMNDLTTRFDDLFNEEIQDISLSDTPKVVEPKEEIKKEETPVVPSAPKENIGIDETITFNPIEDEIKRFEEKQAKEKAFAKTNVDQKKSIKEIIKEKKKENKANKSLDSLFFTKEKKNKAEQKPKVQEFKPVASNTRPSSPSSPNNPNKPHKKKRRRPKSSKTTFVLAIIACITLFFGICGVGGATWFAYRLCRNMPEFNAADLEAADSSIIYDSNGEQIIELGLYLRQNIEYEDLPNCVVDAFVAIEDSRFFGHFGFDIPRFTKALFSNLASGSMSQGGSTITMQLVKNSYFQVDNAEDSTMAARAGMSGIQRKMQEIVLAIEADAKLSKQEILALYLNKVNFGDNIRGIQKAAEYYFGKDASELTLNEGAFLAGIINAPNSYNPYNELYKYDESYIYLDSEIGYLDNANERKNEVLNLMAYHGYITEDEAALNKNVRIEDLVVGKDAKFGNTNTYYQSFIDAVIEEAERVTGKSPYTTAMNIYTSMNSELQEYVYNMQNNPEMFADKYRFRHDDQQNALVVLNNQTGQLVALGGGRDQADQARQFNRATDSYINPGSTIKPVIEYVLAFDRLGYATTHTITDQPVFLYETDIVMSNAYGQGYTGDMTLLEALARSLNTPAIQLMYDLFDYYEDNPNYEHPEDAIIEYCKSIGFNYCNQNTFDVQWAIGGKDCLVSPVQLAGAHGMLINGGKYIAPHTIDRIEYRGKYQETEDYVADSEGNQVVSTAAAYMTTRLLKNNVESGWISQLNLLRRDYPVFAKTGTTNFSEAAYINYSIPETGAKDQWLCTQTSNYTIVVWNGFDQLADGAYFTVDDENYNLKCKMGSMLLDKTMEVFNYNATDLTQPDDCISIDHVLGSFPYVIGDSAHGLISKNSPYATPVAAGSITKENKGGTFYHVGAIDMGDGKVGIHWDEFNMYNGDGTMDISATSVSGKKTVIATGRSYYERYNFVRPDMFYATVTDADGGEHAIESATPTTIAEVGAPGPYNVCGWTSASPSPRCTSTAKLAED